MENNDLTLRYWVSCAWRTYRNNFKKVLAATVLIIVYMWLIMSIRYLPQGDLMANLVIFVTNPAIGVGYCFFFLKLIQEQPARPRDFMVGFVHFVRVWVTALLQLLIFLGGLVLFIIPGIVWGLKYGFGMIAVVDKKLSPLQALKFSGKITYGYKRELFLVFIVGFALSMWQLPFAIGAANLTWDWSVLFLVLGAIPYFFFFLVILPLTMLVWATAYNVLSKQHENV